MFFFLLFVSVVSARMDRVVIVNPNTQEVLFDVWNGTSVQLRVGQSFAIRVDGSPGPFRVKGFLGSVNVFEHFEGVAPYCFPSNSENECLDMLGVSSLSARDRPFRFVVSDGSTGSPSGDVTFSVFIASENTTLLYVRDQTNLGTRVVTSSSARCAQ
jgi:hypothetical protein